MSQRNNDRGLTRQSILDRLHATIKSGHPVIGAGCSVGIVAKAAEKGGADLIIVYSTGKSRIMGLPTTQLGHSNPTTLEMYAEIDNVVRTMPIIGGAQAIDPTYSRVERIVRDFYEVGFDGLINFPTVGVAPEKARQREHVGQGFGREAEMIGVAHKRDYFTMAYCYTDDHARMLAAAGADVMVPHAGWTVGGEVGRGHSDIDLKKSAEHVQRLIDVSKNESPDCICLAHGGAFATPEDTAFLYENTDAVGFVGASSIERIPIERAVAEAVRQFKSLQLKR